MTGPARIYRVLIVDDNSGDHLLFQEAITALALPIKIVSCLLADAALDLLTTDAGFDLIMTDLNMPNMNGMELCAKVEAHAQWKKIPTLIMSSNSKEWLSSTTLGECRSQYLVKPSSWQECLKVMQDIHVILREGSGRGSGRFKAEPALAPY